MSDDLSRLLLREKQRYSILKALYESYEKIDRIGFNEAALSGSQIIELVNFEPIDVFKALEYLVSEHLVSIVARTSGLENSFYSITHSGLVEIEDSIRNPNRGTEHFAVSITQHFHGRNPQVSLQTGNENVANLTQTFSDTSEVLELIQDLNEQIRSFPAQSQDVAAESLEILRQEAGSSNPSPSKLKMALSALWTFGKDITGVANSVSAIAERLGVDLSLFN